MAVIVSNGNPGDLAHISNLYDKKKENLHHPDCQLSNNLEKQTRWHSGEPEHAWGYEHHLHNNSM
jgi:hypothetical protein